MATIIKVVRGAKPANKESDNIFKVLKSNSKGHTVETLFRKAKAYNHPNREFVSLGALLHPRATIYKNGSKIKSADPICAAIKTLGAEICADLKNEEARVIFLECEEFDLTSVNLLLFHMAKYKENRRHGKVK